MSVSTDIAPPAGSSAGGEIRIQTLPLMKPRNYLFGTLVVVFLAVLIFFNRKPPTVEITDLTDQAELPAPTVLQPEPAPPPNAVSSGQRSPKPRVNPRQMEIEIPEPHPSLAVLPVIRVRSDQVLATVNGVRITLKDLTLIDPQSAELERAMVPDMFDMLLNRAVERELAFQFARANDVQLTTEQKRNLDVLKIRENQVDPMVVDTLGRSEANTEFMMQDAAGLMLLHNLAKAGGVRSPHVTEKDVEEYFHEHQNEYPPFPTDPAQAVEVWNAMDAEIRGRLAPVLKTEHDQQFRQFVDQLKAAAQVTANRPI